MTADECPLSELPAGQCACPKHRGGHAPEEEPIETVGQAFTAAYPGDCYRPGCAGIEVGDRIARAADSRSYLHAGKCP